MDTEGMTDYLSQMRQTQMQKELEALVGFVIDRLEARNVRASTSDVVVEVVQARDFTIEQIRAAAETELASREDPRSRGLAPQVGYDC